jgi:hypothetical protein
MRYGTRIIYLYNLLPLAQDWERGPGGEGPSESPG